jgi:hypothetical protein
MAKANRKSTTPAVKAAPVFMDPTTAPDQYALLVRGACMAPLLPDGSAALIDKRLPYESGDLVVIYLRPEAIKSGQSNCMLKRLVSMPPWVTSFPYREHPQSEVHALATAEMLNPARRVYFRCADILAIHRCLGPVPAGTKLNGPLVARVHASDITKAQPSRRAVLAGIAAAPALAAPALADLVDDPIFAAIEAHKTAEVDIEAAIRVRCDLEKSLPKDRRKTFFCAGSQEIIPSDDPRWIAAQKREWGAFEAGDDRACDLLDIRPTTLAGVAALSQYAFDFVARGREWPDALVEDEVAENPSRYAPESYDWSQFLHRHVANSLRALGDVS